MENEVMYYWRYVLKTNKGYKSKFKYKIDNTGDYEIEYIGADEEKHHTWKKESELDKVEVYWDDDENSNVFVYYSLNGSLEHFIALIHKALKDGYENALQRAEYAKSILFEFDMKCKDFKEKTNETK